MDMFCGFDEKKNKIPVLTGMKAFLLLSIFVFHTGFFSNTYYLAQRACDLLFILSGYGIAYKYSKDNVFISQLDTPTKYVKKKLVQMYPVHILTWALALVLFYRNDSFPETIVQSVINLSLTQSWFSYNGCVYYYNAVSWFLSSLMFCYFISPFVLRYSSTKNNKVTFVLLFFLRIGLEILSSRCLQLNTYHNPLFSGLSFAMGMQLFYLRTKSCTWLCNILQANIPFLIIIISIIWNDKLLISCYILLECIFIWSVLNGNGLANKLFEIKYWKLISIIQYEFFMIHQLVIRSMRMYVEDWFILIAGSFVISLALSYAVNHLNKKIRSMKCKG